MEKLLLRIELLADHIREHAEGLQRKAQDIDEQDVKFLRSMLSALEVNIKILEENTGY